MKNAQNKTIIVLIAVILPLYVLPRASNVIDDEVRAGVSGSFIELSHGITHYEVAGSDTAQTVLLVHGFSVPYFIWDLTFKKLVERGFRVIRYDLYGRGFSDRPDVKYDEALYEKQITDLLQALNITGSIDIVGTSMGGALVADYTVNNPEKINSVTLISPFQQAKDASLFQIPVIGPILMRVLISPFFSKIHMKSTYTKPVYEGWPEMYVEQMHYKGFKRSLLSTLKYYVKQDKLPVYKKLNNLNKPVLLVWGTNDKTVRFEGSNRIRSVLACEFLPVEHAGHTPHLDEPELVHGVLIDFLKK